MSMNIQKKNLFTLLFTVCAVISLVWTAPEILNYVEFYKVVEKFQIVLDNISVNTTKIYAGEVLVIVEFKVTNPTEFVGLKVSSITCQLRYINDGSPQFLAGITETFSPHTQVEPLQSIRMAVDFELKYRGYESQIRDFIGYLQTGPERMDWIVTGQFILQAYSSVLPIHIGPLQCSTYLL